MIFSNAIGLNIHFVHGPKRKGERKKKVIKSSGIAYKSTDVIHLNMRGIVNALYSNL